MEKYLFREYDVSYNEFFKQEKEHIKKNLGASVHVEHVGSTAVPGLGGKGIVDVLVGVTELEEVKRRLERAGYEFREGAGTKQRLFFRRDYPYKDGTRRVHLHVTVFGSQDWRETIAFRDWLRKHPEDVVAYAELKRKGVEKAKGEGEIYRKHKEKYVKAILQKALGLNKSQEQYSNR